MRINHFLLIFLSLECSDIWIRAEEIKPFEIDETSIAAGIEHSCAIHTHAMSDVGGRVHCWGENTGGQSSAPDDEFIQVSAGRLHSCGVRMDETVACWGHDAVNPEGLFEQVSSGDFHSCGVLKDKSLKCWGTPGNGQILPPIGKFLQVSCGRAFSCALTTEGEVKCWGENARGQCNVPQGYVFAQISASSGDFVCGVTNENDIVCWGDNSRKQLEPPEKEKFILVSTSRLAACGIKVDKHVICWGMRSGVTAAPKDVMFDELTLGWNHGCGIRVEDGGVQCWGNNHNGRLDVPSVLQ